MKRTEWRNGGGVEGGVAKAYVFQLQLQVGGVAAQSPVLRQQLGVLRLLGAQHRFSLPPLGQGVGQIRLLLLVPGRE